jgi:hypothetical protein
VALIQNKWFRFKVALEVNVMNEVYVNKKSSQEFVTWLQQSKQNDPEQFYLRSIHRPAEEQVTVEMLQLYKEE